jgi:hypothetical protein
LPEGGDAITSSKGEEGSKHGLLGRLDLYSTGITVSAVMAMEEIIERFTIWFGLKDGLRICSK